MRAESAAVFSAAQRDICRIIETLDGRAEFTADRWERTDLSGTHGGGGDTRVLEDGAIFEQAGVNFSEVHGTLPAEMAERLQLDRADCPFYATGVSLVFHPRNPHIPTTHANFRYIEAGSSAWFGGGSDLTPYYLYEDDCAHFHRTLQAICDRHHADFYPAFKKRCDEYFYLPHRGETRGVGGVFFDYLGKDEPQDRSGIFEFVKDMAAHFLDAYTPIVERHRARPWTVEEERFQLHRRGRYVEFNLLYDRGTLFGLKTGGRTESILMSLPPRVCWQYREAYPAGSREAALLEVLQNPRAWA